MVASFCMWLSSVRSPYFFLKKSWPLDISSPQVVFCARLLRAACLAALNAQLAFVVSTPSPGRGTDGWHTKRLHSYLGEEARSGPNGSRKELPKTTRNLESVVASFVFVGCFAGAFSAKIRTYFRKEWFKRTFQSILKLLKKNIKMISWNGSLLSHRSVNIQASTLAHFWDTAQSAWRSFWAIS